MTLNAIIAYMEQPEIAAVILTALLAFIGRMLQPKARVVWGVNHQFCHSVPSTSGGPNLLFYSRNIFLKNMGKGIAENVEVHFGFKPEHFQIWPPCNYSVVTFPDNHFMIKIDHMGKGEHLNIELLQGATELPYVLKLGTAEGDCKAITIIPQQVFSKTFNAFIFILLLLGIYKIFEWVVILFAYWL